MDYYAPDVFTLDESYPLMDPLNTWPGET